MADSRWWARFFEGSALELWRLAHTRDENRGEAADLVRALSLTPGERVLDVPCGYGRLALELAALGLRVCGIDAAEAFVAEGRERARQRGLELDLRLGDMRELPWKNELDGAFCVGNSFGYFDDEGDQAFLRAVASALRPGGRFLLEVPLAAELVAGKREFRDWRRLGERLLLSEGFHDEAQGRMETSYTFVDLRTAGGALETRHASYRVYSIGELTERLRAAGFDSIEWLGDLGGTPFGRDSVACHARARRA